MNMRFVLVRPRNPLNIGAAARAMANFGFSDLAVVKPYAPVWQETRSAVGAEKLVLAARACASLEEATGDVSLVVGTTALRDRRPDRPVVSLPDLAEYLQKNYPEVAAGKSRAALLFGSEKTGLSGPYLARCQFWLTIPTSPETPSMNLGQAVALCAYAWSQVLGARVLQTPPDPGLPATIEERRRLARQALAVFDMAGYLPFLGPREKMQKIRQRFLAWRLQRRDVALLHGLFRFLLKKGPPR